MTTTKIAGAALAALAFALAACGETDKAGGTGDEVTLRVGTDDFANKPAVRQIEEFGRQVEALSGGDIRVEPVYQAAGDLPDDWDQKVARLVTSGKLEAGMIPTRAWDTEGVTTLRPLSAPFLLTTQAAVDEAVSGPVASELMAGLDAAGVVGLALVPEGLRHPFGFEEPFAGPDDYRGKGVRTPLSETAFATFRALGARPDDPNGAAVDSQAAAGRLHGAETSFALAGALPVTVATGNVTLFPKVNSLVINQDVWEDLTDEQRSQLRTAAEGTRDWAIANNVTDAEAAKAFCAAGGEVVLAAKADLEALAAATRPVYEQLERDERTAELIAKLRTIAAAAPEDEAQVEACAGEPAAGEDAGDGSAPAGGGIPEGIYRTRLSIDDLVEAGMNPSTAREYNGVHTLELRDGKLEDFVKSDKPFPACRGTYESTATTLELTFADDQCSGGLTAKWELRGDTLRLSEIHSGTPEEEEITRLVFGLKPFRKID